MISISIKLAAVLLAATRRSSKLPLARYNWYDCTLSRALRVNLDIHKW